MLGGVCVHGETVYFLQLGIAVLALEDLSERRPAAR